MYFLREYEQNVDPKDCIDRWFEFVGVNNERAWEDIEYENYTWLD